MTDEQALENKIKLQKDGVSAWVVNNMRGTFAWATGVGKSKGAIMCVEHVRELGLNKGLLVVPTEEMRDVDWPAEFLKWDCSLDGIRVICYALLAKEDLSQHEFIIYDECHKITLHNLQKLFYFKGPVLGLTATFPDSTFEGEVERVAMVTELLPPVHSVTTDEAVDLGLIADFEVFVLKFYLDAVNKNVHGGTKKVPRMTTEAAQYKKLTKLLQFATMKGIEGMKFVAIAKRMNLIYNLPSKLRLAEKCLERMSDPADRKRTLVLCGSIDQANTLCGENVFHSKETGDALDRFQREEIHLLGAVKALNEGKNLVNLEQELIAQVDSQERNLVQRIGRAVRKRYGNPDFKARIVILVAALTCDEKWYKSAIKDFHSKRIKVDFIRVPDVKKSPLNEPI